MGIKMSYVMKGMVSSHAIKCPLCGEDVPAKTEHSCSSADRKVARPKAGNPYDLSDGDKGFKAIRKSRVW